MTGVRTTYDGPQHCSALKEPQGKTVTMDCPYTGKGEEFSPTNLVEAALAGCMLLSMGALATRNELDISGTRIEVKISTMDKPPMRFNGIDIEVAMPRDFSKKDRLRLERAAEACPIKHSFGSEIPISVSYSYPKWLARDVRDPSYVLTDKCQAYIAKEVQSVLAWRATPQERREPLPRDDLVPEARGGATHAITIRAPAVYIWPWLVQMGWDRAGFYSDDRLDNAGRPSTNRILPELQNTKVGDVLPSRPGSPHGFEVLRMEPPRLFLLGAFPQVPGFSNLPWGGRRPRGYVRSTWLFLLREQYDTTRLVVRVRRVFRPSWLGLIVNTLMAPAHVVMQRKQLLNLRGRAELLARTDAGKREEWYEIEETLRRANHRPE